ncbi:MAG: hypothetical protein NVSMB23_20240 [Myxococcales bacterium]
MAARPLVRVRAAVPRVDDDHQGSVAHRDRRLLRPNGRAGQREEQGGGEREDGPWHAREDTKRAGLPQTLEAAPAEAARTD